MDIFCVLFFPNISRIRQYVWARVIHVKKKKKHKQLKFNVTASTELPQYVWLDLVFNFIQKKKNKSLWEENLYTSENIKFLMQIISAHQVGTV